MKERKVMLIRIIVKKISILTVLITTLLMMAGCQKAPLRLTMDEYPVIDGSTVTIPLSEAVAATVTEQTLEEVRPFILHNKTHQAYLNLIDKKVELIFVTGPSAEELALAKEAGVEFEIVPIVSEGFVFLTHADNPVDNLTSQNLKDIYSGKITSWSELGGDDVAIIPYQRPVNSGSQTGFLEMVMQGETPMAAPEEQVIAEMGMLIDAVASYKNTSSALGYSYYYFVTDMWGNDKVKLLKVDGIYPDDQTIQSGEYPFTTAYYAVMRKDTPSDSNARKVVAFILSEEGQALMEENGYVKISE